MADNIDITHPEIETYLEKQLPEREPWFLEMEQMAKDRGFPAVGPQVGILLEFIARCVNARRIMELGSGYGYSGLWFARALPSDGYLLLTDFKESNRQLAEGFFRKAGQEHLLEFRVGDALELLKREKNTYDIIFNDIDKEFYPQVIEPVYRRLRKGGVFITDNTLWYGKVVQKKSDRATASIKEFNESLREHKGFLAVQLPLRDGVSLGIKIGD